MSYFVEYLDVMRAQLAEVRKLLTEMPVAALDWTPGGEVNSIAVLAAHLAGSNKYWLGDVLGSRESRRDRESEFATHGIDAIDLAARLEATLADIAPIIEALTLEDLTKSRFSPRHGREYSVGWVLHHALEHSAQHVGHAQVVGQIWMLNQAK
ncbi:MAG: DinB family protein [Caldilineaceae bacterium]